MNSLLKCVKSYLIVANSSDYLQQLYKLCMEKVKEGALVVLITCEHYDFSKVLAELNVSKDELKNFILMYYKTIDEVSRKLLFLHSWSLVPSMVAVDLSQLLRMEMKTFPTPALLMPKVSFCAVTLLAYLQSIALKCAANPSTTTVNGLMILQSGVENFGDTEIQTLKDLYFYQTDLFENFDSLRVMMQQAGE